MTVIALLGNPNSGKTTLFNTLTGMRQHVGNFPGVTVELTKSPLKTDSGVMLVDLPGIYTITGATAEERVSRDFLLEKHAGVILNIVDATSPRRGLYLTLQLLELRIPMVVAFNMMDEVRQGGGRIDLSAISDELGVQVLPISASKGEGIDALSDALRHAKTPRWKWLPPKEASLEERILQRYAFIEKLCDKSVFAADESAAQRLSAHVDAILTHRIFAFPIFFAVMALVFYLSFGPVGGLLGEGFRWLLARFVDGVGQALLWAHVPDWLYGLVVGGILAGVGNVLSFLPTILTLFFLLSLLEDSGYMARMAYVTDRLLRRLGLSGRSFVPALLGFGCSVPAILATRTLPGKRDRCMTILLIPFLSCSAKLPIYTMFAQAFFPDHAVLVMLALYVGGVLLAIPIALLLKNVAFPGEAAPFLLELPAYRLPTARSALALVRARATAFIRCAMTTLLLASIAVWALQRVNWSLQAVSDNSGSILADIGRFIAPLFVPLGFGDWRASTALLTGLMAKEGVLASLGVLLAAPTEYALQAALRGMFSPLQAVSFLVFTLLYMPCIAAFSAARREMGGLKYALGAAVFQTGVAWLAACIVYNLGRLLGFA